MAGPTKDPFLSIVFDALGQLDPAAAHSLTCTFDGATNSKAARALGLAELKRASGLGCFSPKVRCA